MLFPTGSNRAFRRFHRSTVRGSVNGSIAVAPGGRENAAGPIFGEVSIAARHPQQHPFHAFNAYAHAGGQVGA